MKLISMTDFVLEQSLKQVKANIGTLRFHNVVVKYANFLKQPLKLSMFIPCDENGKVLKGKPLSPAPDSEWIRWENEGFEFIKAKEKVLFEGFEICDRNEILDCVVHNGEHISISFFKNNTIEYLVKYDLTLTESAIKQLDL